MHIVVINLERSPEKLQRTRQRLADVGLDFEVFRAFDGRSGEHLAVSRYDERAALRHFGHRLNDGEQACFASHFAIWERCVALGETLLVLEDDVGLKPDFREALALALEYVDRLGIVHLTGPVPGSDVPATIAGRIGYLPKGKMGTQAYLLTPGAARSLTRHASVWNAPVDYYLASTWRHSLRSYGFVPPAAWHDDPGYRNSDIGKRVSYRVQGYRDLRRVLSKQRHSVLRKLYNWRNPEPSR